MGMAYSQGKLCPAEHHSPLETPPDAVTFIPLLWSCLEICWEPESVLQFIRHSYICVKWCHPHLHLSARKILKNEWVFSVIKNCSPNVPLCSKSTMKSYWLVSSFPNTLTSNVSYWTKDPIVEPFCEICFCMYGPGFCPGSGLAGHLHQRTFCCPDSTGLHLAVKQEESLFFIDVMLFRPWKVVSHLMSYISKAIAYNFLISIYESACVK